MAEATKSEETPVTKPEVKVIKIMLTGDGGMKWDVPEKNNVPRRQVYILLGMIDYTKRILNTMLSTTPKGETK